MGRIPPPPALTKEQFNQAIARGARTLFEIDPALGRWDAQQRLYRAAGSVCVVLGVTVVVVVLLLIFR